MAADCEDVPARLKHRCGPERLLEGETPARVIDDPTSDTLVGVDLSVSVRTPRSAAAHQAKRRDHSHDH
jgi:hypothetical protein